MNHALQVTHLVKHDGTFQASIMENFQTNTCSVSMRQLCAAELHGLRRVTPRTAANTQLETHAEQYRTESSRARTNKP